MRKMLGEQLALRRGILLLASLHSADNLARPNMDSRSRDRVAIVQMLRLRSLLDFMMISSALIVSTSSGCGAESLSMSFNTRCRLLGGSGADAAAMVAPGAEAAETATETDTEAAGGDAEAGEAGVAAADGGVGAAESESGSGAIFITLLICSAKIMFFTPLHNCSRGQPASRMYTALKSQSSATL